MESPDHDLRSRLMTLVRTRDEIEAEILRMLDELSKHNVGMDEPLVDNEGYPRSDIDICAVRYLRHEIICKKNDCKDLTKQIEEGLHVLHSGSAQFETPALETRHQSSEKPLPFAKVDIVDDGSPAQKADLCAGDLILRFASITANNFDNLSTLSDVVAQNVEKPIRVNVLRNAVVVPLILVPQTWSGPGYLGCKIIPLHI